MGKKDKTMSITKENNIVSFPVPSPVVGDIPIKVKAVELIGGDNPKIRFTFEKAPDVKIESFSFAVRISEMPFGIEDKVNSFHDFTCKVSQTTDGNIFTKHFDFKREIGSNRIQAIVTSVTTADKKSFTYSEKDYLPEKTSRTIKADDFVLTKSDLHKASDETLPKGVSPKEASSKKTSSKKALPNEALTNEALTNEALTKEALTNESISQENSVVSDEKNEFCEWVPPQYVPIEKRKSAPKNKRRVKTILAIVAAVLIVEIISGVLLFRYSDVKKTVGKLTADFKYDEAYAIADHYGYKNLVQSVCEEASLFYFRKGNLEMSYIFAAAAPSQFTDVVIDYAASSVFNKVNGDINNNAFCVAKMAKDDDKFTSIVQTMIAVLEGREEYPNALRLTEELRSDEAKRSAEESIYYDAVKYYLSLHKFDELIGFFNQAEKIDILSDHKKLAVQSINTYCLEAGDISSLLYLSTMYPDLASSISIDLSILPDDSGVHSALGVIYPILTADQKRAYHSKKIAASKDIFVIENNKIDGLNISDAVSVDSSEFITLVLRNDGSVVQLDKTGHDKKLSIPKYKDVVKIAVGNDHAVFLHDDGTVTAIGDNTYGQCNVSGWTDIVCVEAGKYFTLGLRIDGTLVACGSNFCGQCDVDGYRNVVDIECCDQTSVMLFSDRTVGLCGYRSFGLDRICKLTGVTAIRGDGTAILAKTEDGSIKLYSGINFGSYGTTYSWKDIVDFDVGSVYIAARDVSGNLIVSGDGAPELKNN